MSKLTVEKKENCSHRFLTSLALASVAVVAVAGASLATQEPPTPIDVLKTEAAKVTGVFDDVKSPAIWSTVFGIGALLVKRVAYS